MPTRNRTYMGFPAKPSISSVNKETHPKKEVANKVGNAIRSAYFSIELNKASTDVILDKPPKAR